MKQNFADLDRKSLNAADINVGDEVTPMDIELTHTIVASTAIASMDYMPVHHDKDYALSQGAPDIFMNILTTNGYMARFVTDWAGPEAMVRNIKIRLGVPAIPDQVLRFSGEVLSKENVDGECLIEVSAKAANDMGDHASGTVTLSLPL